MLNQLFVLPSTIERLRQGPLAEHLDAYAAARVRQGYRLQSIGRQIVAISDFSQWLQRKYISVADLDRGVIDRFLRVRSQQGQLCRGDPKALTRLLEMLCQAGVATLRQEPVPENACSRMVSEYQQYLLQERGLSRSTLLNYVPVIAQFLSARF